MVHLIQSVASGVLIGLQRRSFRGGYDIVGERNIIALLAVELSVLLVQTGIFNHLFFMHVLYVQVENFRALCT
jgi:hypothetical protein